VAVISQLERKHCRTCALLTDIERTLSMARKNLEKSSLEEVFALRMGDYNFELRLTICLDGSLPENLKLTSNILRSFQYSHNVSQKCQARFQAIWAVDFEKQSRDKIGILYYCEQRGRFVSSPRAIL